MNEEEKKPAQEQQLSPELEAKLLEQEHRWHMVLRNYHNRKQWEDGDPRRSAVATALARSVHLFIATETA